MGVTAARSITAEQFGDRPDPGHPEELERGTIVAMPPPSRRHGQVCGQVYFLVRSFVDQHGLGHVLCNDSGVITERSPDTVRGADVAYYSYDRLPPGPLPLGYGPEVPELVFEVRSPSERWSDLLRKVGEYLNAGVAIVCALDPEARSALVSTADQPPRMLTADDELTLPGVLDGFAVRVGRLFD